MSSEKAQQLRKIILKNNTEISQLKKQLEYSETANIKYNKALINKAVCKKELEEMRQSFFSKFFKKFIPHKNKKLICDYFRT